MKIKIGLVDDHQLFLKSLSLMLETLQLFEVVLEAVDGQEMQKKLSLLQASPDIILLDVNMPVMDGIATTLWLKENHPTIKLVALTMNDRDHSIIRMFRAGCCAYLLKDVHPADLKKALQQVYAQGYYNSDSHRFNPGRLFLKAESEMNIAITAKEQRFLHFVCTEMTYKQIAQKMAVSERTVDGYRESLFHKFGVQSRVGLCLEALRKDFVQL